MKITVKDIVFYIVFFIFSIMPLFYNTDTVRDKLFYNYLIQISFFLIYLASRQNKLSLFLSPLFLTLFYLNVNFLIGSWAFNNGYITNKEWLNDYNHLNNFNLITLYFNLSNFLILMSNDFFRIRTTIRIKIRSFKIPYNINSLILWITLLAILSQVTISFGFLGGHGNFTIIPKTILALMIIIYIYKKGGRFRFLYYTLLLLFFISFSYHSKREAIFLIFPITILELYNKRFRYKIKTILLTIIPTLIIIYFILIMSIARGYGGYKVDSVFEATEYVDDYFHTNNFIAYFMNNIEVSSTTYNSTKAIDIIIEKPELITYGETFIKFFFIPIPRYIFPKKPNSMVDIYTKESAPEFRKIGGSYPISLQSEAFWNFHFIGLLFLYIFFTITNIFYKKLLLKIDKTPTDSLLLLLYLYTLFFYIVRGNGLDIFLLYFLIGSFSYFLIKYLTKFYLLLVE